MSSAGRHFTKTEKVYLLSGLSAPRETSYFYSDPDAVCFQLWAVSILIDFFFVEEKRAVSHFSEVIIIIIIILCCTTLAKRRLLRRVRVKTGGGSVRV